MALGCVFPGGGGGMGYSLILAIKVCAAPKGMVFSAILVINRVLILVILVQIGYGFALQS